MRMLGNATGVSKIKVLIVLAVLGLGFTQGLKYLSVQIDYQRMKDAMETKASVAQVLKDEEILSELAMRSKELGLPMEREHFILNRDEGQGVMTIQTAWTVSVRYLWGICGERCDQSYHFEPIVRANYRK